MDDAQAPSSESRHRMISSRGEFHDAVRQAFEQAASIGCRELFISDTDFADWPLGEIAVVENLSRWALPHRRLTVLAQTYADLAVRHVRWVAFRRQWSHVVTCRALDEIEPGKMPTLLLAPGLMTVRLFDRATWRGSISTHLGDGIKAKEHLDALLQHSTDAFPATVLGL